MATAEAMSAIVNDYGVLARQAMYLVYHANKFQSEIFLESNGKTATAKSINAIMAMELEEGDEIKIIADGSDAEEAAAKIKEIIDSFDDKVWWSNE